MRDGIKDCNASHDKKHTDNKLIEVIFHYQERIKIIYNPYNDMKRCLAH